ncbi:MAG: hypothetical protein OXC80_11560 [Gammaproteobacteria bacterium]|nr:hypothetical protein [Gammaproteobacteria bacterium]
MDRNNLNIWTNESNRFFAIGTCEVEALYTLRYRIAQLLLTEVFHGIDAIDSCEKLIKFVVHTIN